MSFLQLTLYNGERTFINMELVYEMRDRAFSDSVGTRLWISTAGEGDSIDVTETCEEVLAKL